jgi:hypothetical protein
MAELVDEILKDKVPEGFEFQSGESETEFILQEVEETGLAIFEVNLKAKLIPEIELDKIKQALAGKYPGLGKTYLENLPYVSGTEIEIRPKLPEKILTFPRMTENIDIEITVR